MKEFRPEMTVVRFGAEDTIATSGTSVILSGFGDSRRGNNTFSFGGNDYTQLSAGTNFVNFREDLSDYLGDPTLNNCSVAEMYFGDRPIKLVYDALEQPALDGEYTYNGAGTWSFTKKQ